MVRPNTRATPKRNCEPTKEDSIAKIGSGRTEQKSEQMWAKYDCLTLADALCVFCVRVN